MGAVGAVQTVFVTGATGFVGRAVVHALRADGLKVRCLVRRGSERDLKGLEAIERVEGDILARQTLDEGIGGCDAVVHLVGIIREHRGRGITFEQIHVDGTLNVLAAAAAANVRRYLHMSALGTSATARSRYHQTKWLAEEAVRASALPWTIFRPSVIYGKGDGFVSMLAQMVGEVAGGARDRRGAPEGTARAGRAGRGGLPARAGPPGDGEADLRGRRSGRGVDGRADRRHRQGPRPCARSQGPPAHRAHADRREHAAGRSPRSPSPRIRSPCWKRTIPATRRRSSGPSD